MFSVLALILIIFSTDFFQSTTIAESATSHITCSDNEQYYDDTLSPLCDTNCQDLQRFCDITKKYAVAGCYCQLGYARNLRQKCIPVNDCYADCQPGEQAINRLQSNCERACNESANTPICYGYNERNCVCATGYCRNSRGQCVEYVKQAKD